MYMFETFLFGFLLPHLSYMYWRWLSFMLSFVKRKQLMYFTNKLCDNQLVHSLGKKYAIIVNTTKNDHDIKVRRVRRIAQQKTISKRLSYRLLQKAIIWCAIVRFALIVYVVILMFVSIIETNKNNWSLKWERTTTTITKKTTWHQVEC